jgi:antirestriction protein ArdC
MKSDLYQTVTDQIVAALEKGVAPWVKPWSGEADPIPVNAMGERAYRGVNVLLLNLRSLFAGYPRNRWLTYRQAASLGGQVRTGETGVQILYYQLRKVPARVEVFPGKDEPGIPDKVIPLLRAYTVFNIAQVDGLPQAPIPVSGWREDAEAQALLDASAAVIRHGGYSAYYLPPEDRIQLPPPSYFRSAGGYYSTALHELLHWTGHPSRCNRQLTNRFGTDAYAAEELIAEIGSAFLCAHCRIDGRLQHAAYIDHWLKVLRADKRAIFVASTRAQQAADYLTGCLVTQPGAEQREAA